MFFFLGCVCVCAYVCLHTLHNISHTYIYLCTHMLTCIHVFIFIHIHIHTYVYTKHTYTYIHTSHIFIYLYTHQTKNSRRPSSTAPPAAASRLCRCRGMRRCVMTVSVLAAEEEGRSRGRGRGCMCRCVYTKTRVVGLLILYYMVSLHSMLTHTCYLHMSPVLS